MSTPIKIVVVVVVIVVVGFVQKQAGAELGQAQLKWGLGFTSTIDSQ